ncbi:MAG: MiaB/RimO family radical SAM methylthiotransferase, partial [Deltaproteobacteria bacterium]|nr:MiaB/RimO family radical SAM methylthiotransferase [Deltaproteobacteria bacterium]
MSKKIAIATLGCKVNQYDSAQLTEILKKDDYQIVSDQEAADVYIVNSCTVTAKADQEARHLLRRFQKKNPNATLVLTGCYAQTHAEELSKFSSVHYVVGNTLKTKISEILKEQKTKPKIPELHIQNAFQVPELPQIEIESFPDHTRVFLKIQDGCDDFCTFCIIPYARGKSRSLTPEAVISQMNLLVQKETQDLSPKTNLAELISKIEKETSLLRLRISSLEPEDVNDELLSVLKNSEKFCPHFHLPLQSGEDFILKKMQRNYTTHYYENLISKITRDFKDVFIGTDVICGFPGETEEQAQASFHFLENLPWSKLHVFP